MNGRHFVYVLKGNGFKVLDGDTVKVYLDHGRNWTEYTSLRLAGLDTPEKKNTKHGGLLEKEAGLLVGSVVLLWLEGRASHVQLYATSDAKPKYAGRTVGRLYAGWPTFKAGDDCLNDYLLAQELCRPYKGGKRPKWTKVQLRAIIARAQAILAA